MVSTIRSSGAYRSDAGAFEAPRRSTPASDRSATRTDIALLVSMLFLPRFTLTFGKTFLQLELVPIGLILMYQFLCGKTVIQYDRLLWFLLVGLAATFSLLVNFNINMLSAYALFIVFYFMFTFSRFSTPDQYKRTLHAFQFLVALLSSIGVVQFAAQFVVDGKELINFYGMIPEFLFSEPTLGMHDPRMNGGIIQATGLFLPEPSFLGQLAALGILIEILEFRRLRYLTVMALGFLLAYSGTGLMLLLLFGPLAVLRRKQAAPFAVFVVVVIVGLVATGVINLSAFTDRVGEFDETRSSGFMRFVGPIWVAAESLDIGNLPALLVGHGPGTVKIAVETKQFSVLGANWLKLFDEYGVIGSFIFYCFLVSCLRGSRCPGIAIAAVVFAYVFLQGNLLIAIPLCTLNGLESRRRYFHGSGASPAS